MKEDSVWLSIEFFLVAVLGVAAVGLLCVAVA